MADQIGKEQVRIVICTYQSRRQVGSAVESCLIEGLFPGQLTVVDNASTDGTFLAVSRSFPEVRLLAMGRNLGFAAATNRAAAEAGGEALMMLNPDAELRKGALAAMLQGARLGGRVWTTYRYSSGKQFRTHGMHDVNRRYRHLLSNSRLDWNCSRRKSYRA